MPDYVGLHRFLREVGLKELSATPSPVTGYAFVYPKTDGKLYYLKSDGTEVPLVETELITRSTLTFPIDYNDAGAVDPGPTDTFSTQQEIDDFLAANGATNFKHLMACWDAAPVIVKHELTFNLAAGVHRPRPSEVGGQWAFPLVGKIFRGVNNIYLNGADASQWEEIIANAPATYTNVGGEDPTLEVPSAPYVGQNLKGLWARSGAALSPIHFNDDDTVKVVADMSPTPTDVSIVRPGTKLRNSESGSNTSPAASLGLFYVDSGGFYPYIWFNDLQLDQIGVTWGINITSGFVLLQNSTFDFRYQQDFGASPNGRATQATGENSAVYFYFASLRGGSSATDQPIYATSRARASFLWSVVYNAHLPITATQDAALSLTRTVVDSLNTSGAILVHDGAKLYFQDNIYVGQGKQLTIRNCANGQNEPAVEYEGGETPSNVQDQLMGFENNNGPCVKLLAESLLSIDSGIGLADLGGNLDVGVQVEGPRAFLSLPSGVTVTGSVGDIRMSDGSIWSYADLDAEGRLIDDGLTVVEKKT